MREFLIKCIEDDWSLFCEGSEVFHPNSIAFRHLPGTQYRIEVTGVPIYFAYEFPGIHICVEGELADSLIHQVLLEVLDNLQQVTGQSGEIVEL